MFNIVNRIYFPEFTGLKCNMMPFIQGDASSLPKEYKPYFSIIESNFLEKGDVGFLTIHESVVEKGLSQRGYNSFGISRNVHIEVGRTKTGNRWGSSWGGRANTVIEDKTMVLISNSISETCRVWDAMEMANTADGDLSEYIDRYPEQTGVMLQSGEVAKISIFTPHECVPQRVSGQRQFFRIVGKGVHGREDYFTVNPLCPFIS